MRKILCRIIGAVILFGSHGALAYQSTINPVVPAQSAPLTSSIVRGNFSAAYNDINNIYQMLSVLPANSAALASIAGLNTSANMTLYTTAPNTYATTALTAYARTLLAQTNTAGAQSILGLSSTVTGPTIATDTAITRFDGTTGKLLKNSLATIDDSGNIAATNLSGTNTGDQTITLTGNVTGSGTGSFATTIANSAVTNAKLANMANATFKGRITAGSGAPEDLTSTQATSLLNPFTSTLQGLAPASGGGTTNFLRADGAWTALPVFSSTLNGVAPASGGGTTNFLRADGAWTTPPAGTGTVSSVSVVSSNGLAGTVATATTTPAITLSTTITGLLKGNGTAISAAAAGTDYSTFAGPGSATDTALARYSGTTGNLIQNSGVLLDGSNNMSGVGTISTGTDTITSSSANALAVGGTGTTNPALNVDASTSSSATGINIKSAAAGGGVIINAISSGTNEALTMNAKGSGGMNIATSGTGGVIVGNSTNTTTSLRAGSSVAWNIGGTDRVSVTSSAATFAPTLAATAATPRFSVVSGADTNLTASTEATHTYFNLGTIRQHASNTAITTQRDFRITGSTHAFSGATGTITDAAAFSVDGPDIAGTNAAITNSSGILVPTLALTGTITNGIGLNVSAPSGATNNYAAIFTGNTQIKGGLFLARTTFTSGATYTMVAGDYGILINKGTGSATGVTLLGCNTANDGRVIVVSDEKGDAGTNNITLTPASGTIRNAATFVINANFNSVHLQCDGSTTNWVPQ